MTRAVQYIIAILQLLFALSAIAQEKTVTGLASMHVPPGFTIEIAATAEMAPYCMCAAFDDRGRLFLCQSSGKNISGRAMGDAPECKILMLEDTNKDGVFDKSTVYADKLTLPMGLQWYRGSLYVGAAPELLKFTDTDGDGVADKREVILSGWNLHNTASLHGPFLGPDGWLYLTHGRHGYNITTREGVTLKGQAARVWRCKPDGTQLERVCGGGFDNPVEITFTTAGEMIGTMTYFTDPHNGQRDALMHWMEGGVHLKNYSEVMGEFTFTGELLPPMTKFARIAPAGLMTYRGASFGAEFKDNLFTAQFNPHRVQRHKVIRQGATFHTEDEDFLTSTDPDFHPCDVLEDADGSLLVVDTGGWYVDACPLSRISRPEIRGAIFRIRKNGAPKVDDPRGLKLGLEKSSTQQLVAALNDARPAVRDRAVDLLAQMGKPAIADLATVLKEKTGSVEARCAAISALSQIGARQAQAAVYAGFGDADISVRIAAARSAGMARDEYSVSGLLRLVQTDVVSVRREAATALGRIGDLSAVSALLKASSAASDRFIEHAIIYALIELKDTNAVVEALKSPEARTRKAALIALDQMEGHPLQREQLVAMLADKQEVDRNAALWVAAHHPEWSADLVSFLRERLTGSFSKISNNTFWPVLRALMDKEDVQTMLAELLAQSGLDTQHRNFIISTIDNSALKTIPAPLVKSLGQLLENSDASVRAQIIGLLRSRGASGLDAAVRKIAGDTNEPASLRVAALGALSSRHPHLTAPDLEFLFAQLKRETEASLRLSAAQVLAKASLNDEQLLQLAREQLPQSDALVFPVLLNAFSKSTNSAVGQSLVAAILKTTVNLNQLGGGRLEELLKNFPPDVLEAAQPLFTRIQAQQESRKGRLAELEPLLTGGDVGRGRNVFFGQKAACFGCHSIGKEGGILGPDLTSVGAIRSGRDIIEAIVFPSASFVPGYEPYRIETDEDTYTGVIGSQTAEAITFRTGANAAAQILRNKIKSMTPGTVSIMPEGLDVALSKTELMDLLAFLQAQNGNPFLQPKKK